MQKVLRALVFIMAAVGCAAIAFLAMQGVIRVRESGGAQTAGGTLASGQAPAAVSAGTAPGTTAMAAPGGDNAAPQAGQPAGAAPAAGSAQAAAGGGSAAAPVPVSGSPAAAAPAASGPLPSNPALAAVVQDYRRAAADAATSAAGGEGGAAPGSFAAQLASKPARTPDATAKVIRKWPTGKKWVALTYDDGPHGEFTPKLMDMLVRKNVNATFFLLGESINKHPDIAKALVDAGFEVANHTMNHKQFRQLTEEQIREEVAGASQLIKEVTGADVTVMRPPYNQSPDKAQKVIHDELGLKMISWDVDTQDSFSPSRQPSAEAMIAGILKNTGDGSIILMHDRQQKVIDVSEKVIDELRKQGYEFVTVSELLGLKPRTPLKAAAGGGGGAAPAQQPAAAAPGQAEGQQVAAPAPAPAPAAPAPAGAAASAPAAAAPAPIPAAAADPLVGNISANKLTVPPGGAR